MSAVNLFTCTSNCFTCNMESQQFGDQKKCEQCEKMFSNISNLRKHIKTKHGLVNKCGNCRKMFSSAKTLLEHIESCDLRSLICPFCDKTSDNYKHLVSFHRHYRFHDENKGQCEEWGKIFGGKKSLQGHVLLVHLKETKSVCVTCNKPFSKMSNLSKHLKTYKEKQDSSEETKCQICKKIFSKEGNLTKHETIAHPDGKQFLWEK